MSPFDSAKRLNKALTVFKVHFFFEFQVFMSFFLCLPMILQHSIVLKVTIRVQGSLNKLCTPLIGVKAIILLVGVNTYQSSISFGRLTPTKEDIIKVGVKTECQHWVSTPTLKEKGGCQTLNFSPKGIPQFFIKKSPALNPMTPCLTLSTLSSQVALLFMASMALALPHKPPGGSGIDGQYLQI